MVNASIVGKVEQRDTDRRRKALLQHVRLTSETGDAFAVPKACFTWYPQDALDALPQDGQALQFSGNIYHPSGQQNPHGFDFRTYLLQRGIPVGISGARDMQFVGEAVPGFWYTARASISNLLDQLMGDDSALAKALLIGDRDDLPDETRKDFQVTGIAHVLAVSGLHVSILLAGLGALLKWMRVGAKGRLIILAVFLLAYARLLDFSAPVVRASILGIVLLSANATHQRADPLTSLGLAFSLILLVRPMDITSIGFQLSFAAVLGIILLGDRLEHWYAKAVSKRPVPKLVDKTIRAFLVTVAASVFTAPLIAQHFHQATPVGLLLSPLACLLVAWIMMWVLAVLPLVVIWLPAAQVAVFPAVLLSRALLWLSDLAASLEGGLLRVAAPGALALVCCYAVMVLFSRYVRLGYVWRAGLSLAAAAVVVGLAVLSSPQQPVRWTQLSMGSADAAIVEDGGTTYVVDVGAHGGDVASYLHAEGRTIDALFITHLHKDHVGGLMQLMDAGVPIKRIVIPEGAKATAVEDNSLSILLRAEQAGIPIAYAAAGDRYEQGRVAMKVLWPQRGKVYPGRDANLHALSMLWTLNGHTLLTAGDLDGQYEHYSAAKAQLLKVAHHGSKYSTSEEYLHAVQPRAALLSASQTYLERATDVLERLDARDIPVYGTPEHGALILTFGDDGPTIHGYAAQEGK